MTVVIIRFEGGKEEVEGDHSFLKIEERKAISRE